MLQYIFKTVAPKIPNYEFVKKGSFPIFVTKIAFSKPKGGRGEGEGEGEGGGRGGKMLEVG